MGACLGWNMVISISQIHHFQYNSSGHSTGLLRRFWPWDMVTLHRKHRMKFSSRSSACLCLALSSRIASTPSGKSSKNSTQRKLSICKSIWCYAYSGPCTVVDLWVVDISGNFLKKREKVTAINRYMRDKQVNSSLNRRIGAYIEYIYKRQHSRDEPME